MTSPVTFDIHYSFPGDYRVQKWRNIPGHDTDGYEEIKGYLAKYLPAAKLTGWLMYDAEGKLVHEQKRAWLLEEPVELEGDEGTQLLPCCQWKEEYEQLREWLEEQVREGGWVEGSDIRVYLEGEKE